MAHPAGQGQAFDGPEDDLAKAAGNLIAGAIGWGAFERCARERPFMLGAKDKRCRVGDVERSMIFETVDRALHIKIVEAERTRSVPMRVMSVRA